MLLGIAWIALLSPLSVPLLPLLYVDPASAYGGIAILGIFILLGAAGSLVAMLLAGVVLRRTPSPPERQLAGATLFVPVAALNHAAAGWNRGGSAPSRTVGAVRSPPWPLPWTT